MNDILGAIGFILALIVIVCIVLYIAIIKPGAVGNASKSIVNKFEPENTAPKMTDMVDYHKSHEKTQYNIERD